MSCRWDVKCLDCNVQLGMSEANHAVALMRSIVRHAKTLASVLPFQQEDLYGMVELRTSYGMLDLVWLAAHCNHRLVPISEYGEIDGQCGLNITCSECGSDHECKLAAGHAGPCSFKVTA